MRPCVWRIWVDPGAFLAAIRIIGRRNLSRPGLFGYGNPGRSGRRRRPGRAQRRRKAFDPVQTLESPKSRRSGRSRTPGRFIPIRGRRRADRDDWRIHQGRQAGRATGQALELIDGAALAKLMPDIEMPAELPLGANQAPSCPNCGLLMVARRNRKTGESFWGCTSFPKCKGTKPA